MPRYIGIFNLPKPTREHAQIDNVIRDAASGTFKKVVLGSSVVLYLFDSNTKPHNYSFSRIMHNGDEVAFFEIGDYFTSEGFRAIEGWLNTHRKG